MVEHSEAGECHSECKTIAKACDGVPSKHNLDLAEQAWNAEVSRSELTQKLCWEPKKCSGKHQGRKQLPEAQRGKYGKEEFKVRMMSNHAARVPKARGVHATEVGEPWWPFRGVGSRGGGACNELPLLA